MYTFFFTEKSPFSQFHRCLFTAGELTFMCAEQYMMHGKAILFGDREIAAQIMVADTPMKQKALGRKVKGFDDKVWKQNREVIVLAGNRLKFTQNPDLKAALLATKGTTLVEASPYDRIWGIGLSAKDPRAQNEATWKGQNLLGKILTKLRDELLAEEA
ncbi:MAG: NADAR family protein [Kofleriaceae bacterium]